MTKTIENLVLPLALQEIEREIERIVDLSLDVEAMESDLRAQLVRYVLERVPACYGLVEEDLSLEAHRVLVPHLIQQQLHGAVQEAIQCLIGPQCAWDGGASQPEADPSHWFG